MEAEIIFEVVKKLTGDIEPYGDSNIDNNRSMNLESIMELTSLLLQDIEMVARSKTRQEYSMKCMGDKASYFLKTLHQEFDLSQEK